VEPADVAAALVDAPSGTWVSVAAANHETGVIHPSLRLPQSRSRQGGSPARGCGQALGKLELTGLASCGCGQRLRPQDSRSQRDSEHSLAPQRRPDALLARGSSRARTQAGQSGCIARRLDSRLPSRSWTSSVTGGWLSCANPIERWLGARGKRQR
jgi:hypothetical protein